MKIIPSRFALASLALLMGAMSISSAAEDAPAPAPYQIPANTPAYIRKAVEFASFGQYFTTLLSDIVGDKGVVYMYDLPYTEQRAGAASRAFVAAHPNSKYELVDYNTLKLPANIDIVFNVLYYHDLPLNNID